MTIVLDDSDIGYLGKRLVDDGKIEDLTLGHFSKRIERAVGLADYVYYKVPTDSGKQVVKFFKENGEFV